MREIKFRYIFEDIKEDGRTLVTQIWNLNDVEINDIVYDTEVLIARNQYTGLKDKNDVEIYEGDIVKDGSRFWEIEISPIYGIFFILSKGLYTRCYGDFASYLVDDFQVIGNIYENQELLES